MHRLTPAFLILSLLLLAACGRGEPADGTDDVRSAADLPVPAPAGPGGEDTAPPSPRADPDVRPEAAPGGERGTDATAPPPRPETSPPAAAPSGADGPEAILRRVEQAYEPVRSMQATFVQRVQVPLLDADERSRGVLYQRGGDRLALRFTDPEGDRIVADGQYLWMYHPSTDPDQVIRSRLQRGAAGFDVREEFLRDAATRFRATHDGREQVGGRSAEVLTLVPRERSSYARIRIWVDRQDHLVRRFEIVEESGNVRRIELSDLRTNVSIPESVFEFTPPDGVRVFEP